MGPLGTLLEKVESERNISQATAASLCQITAGYYSQLRKGKKSPSPRVIVGISRGLGIEESEIYRVLSRRQPEPRRPIFVGVSGPSGSGKSSLMRRVVALEPSVGHLELDRYYRSEEQVEKLPFKWDNPEAIEWDAVIADLKMLRQRASPSIPTYDKMHSTRGKEELFLCKPVVVIEGHMLFHHERMQDKQLLDLRVWIETDGDVRLPRRIERDFEDFHWSHEKVVNQYVSDVRPAYERYFRWTRQFAHIIFPNNVDISRKEIEGATAEAPIAVQMLLSYLRSLPISELRPI